MPVDLSNFVLVEQSCTQQPIAHLLQGSGHRDMLLRLSKGALDAHNASEFGRTCPAVQITGSTNSSCVSGHSRSDGVWNRWGWCALSYSAARSLADARFMLSSELAAMPTAGPPLPPLKCFTDALGPAADQRAPKSAARLRHSSMHEALMIRTLHHRRQTSRSVVGTT